MTLGSIRCVRPLLDFWRTFWRILHRYASARPAVGRSVITALHRATQKNVPITLAAAGLPQIPRLTGEARSYAERRFSFPVIGGLSASDATAALVEPVPLPVSVRLV